MKTKYDWELVKVLLRISESITWGIFSLELSGYPLKLLEHTRNTSPRSVFCFITNDEIINKYWLNYYQVIELIALIGAGREPAEMFVARYV